MSTTDNIGRYVTFFERHEVDPENPRRKQFMNYHNIQSHMLQNESLYKKFDDIKDKHTFATDNFRRAIPESFIFVNEEAEKFLTHCHWTNYYSLIRSQSLIPVKAIKYFVINYIDRPNGDTGKFTHFIIGMTIDTADVTKEFTTEFSKSKHDNLSPYNRNFIQYLKTQMKYHFEEMNNLTWSSIDENMEISTRISKANTGYMSQKKIDQPVFLVHSLYDFQRADVWFLKNREEKADSTKLILDELRVVNFGQNTQVIFDKDKAGNDICEFHPKRTVHNYKGVFNSFYGGCLCNSPGLGKTLEILTLCGLEPSLNLIVVPEHLRDHWVYEFEKHIKAGHIELIKSVDDGVLSKIPTHPTKPTIVLTVYNKLSSSKRIMSMQFDRIIVDEFHELFDKKERPELIYNVKAKYKWAVTATPFINSQMIKNILDFVSKNKLGLDAVTKYKCYLDVFSDMFRKNTKQSVKKEIKLPKINEKTFILKLSEMERTMLDSICASGVDKETSETRQMAFCINPNLYFQDANGVSETFNHVNICETKVKNMHCADFERIFRKLVSEIKKFLKVKKEADPEKEFMINRDLFTIYDYIANQKDNFELRKDCLIRMDNERSIFPIGFDINKLTPDNISRFWKELISHKLEKYGLFGGHMYDDTLKGSIKRLAIDLERIKSTMIFFEQQMKLINKKTNDLKSRTDAENMAYEKVDETTEDSEITCSICLGEISDDFTLLQCGHSYCTDCLKLMLAQSSDKCPQCNFSLKNTTFYTPIVKKVINKDFEDLIKKYGTKIAHLINICKNVIPDDKTIVYCDSPSLIKNLVIMLNENDIKTITPSPDVSIIETVNDFKLYHQVLVLSSEFNASGLNVQFAKSIILLQPIKGEYARVKQTENQIIGRIHRIGQSSEVNLIRLIIKDSIESEILRRNKIIDTEISDTQVQTDFPKTNLEVIEKEDY